MNILYFCSFIIAIIMDFNPPFGIIAGITNYLKCLSVSITGFGLIFPYAFNYRWWRKITFSNNLHVWVSQEALRRDHIRYTLRHLSKTATPDKWFIKYNVHWLVRLLLYITLFTLSVIWFV